jgi:hypothetical protein
MTHSAVDDAFELSVHAGDTAMKRGNPRGEQSFVSNDLNSNPTEFRPHFTKPASSHVDKAFKSRLFEI